MARLLSVKSFDRASLGMDPNGNLSEKDTADKNGIINGGFDRISIDSFITGGDMTAVDVSSAHSGKSREIKLMSPTFTKPKSHTGNAVEVRLARKNYGTGVNAARILQDLNMTVKKGTIYSLLGSSGCGKTTLLTCIVGVKNLDSGQILINGVKPGTPGIEIPGKNIGYMPQDIALYDDFTIKETLHYFGRLNRMQSTEIVERAAFLIDLLKVPVQSRRVGSLSGGQKRRVSVAVSIIHSPPLIILDEPTVGVDPLLRESIWKHLKKIVSGGKSTVIITTHYIGEAEASDSVGVMRNGRLLTEKSPAELFREFNTNSLNDIVLQLCHNDEKLPPVQSARPKSTSSVKQILRKLSLSSVKSAAEFEENPPKQNLSESVKGSLVRIKSLIRKNFFVLTRNIVLLLFAILTPATQCLLLGFAVGNQPKPVAFGVVNNELNGSACDPIAMQQLPPCIIANLSCKYIDSFAGGLVTIRNYPTIEEAREDIRLGNIHTALTFPVGYSDFIYSRANRGIASSNATIDGSTMTVDMDASNSIMTAVSRKLILETYISFIGTVLNECGFNPQLGNVPIKFDEPVFGNYDTEFREFLTVGVIIAFAFFFPICTSSVAYIWDKKQGTMERARVSGTQTWEIIFSYFVSEGFIVLFQTVGLFLILFVVFGIKNEGSLLLALAISILTGFSGISLGLLFGAICGEEITAVLLALAVICPSLFLAGPIWPLLGMPPLIKSFAYTLPATLSTEAFRVIVTKGWGFTHLHVWTGFLATLGWICLYWVVNIGVHRLSLAKQ